MVELLQSQILYDFLGFASEILVLFLMIFVLEIIQRKFPTSSGATIFGLLTRVFDKRVENVGKTGVTKGKFINVRHFIPKNDQKK